MKSVPKVNEQIAETKETSEMRLLRAVLKSAVLDYLSTGDGISAISNNWKLDQKRAKSWLFHEPIVPNSPPFSFGWICQHLGEDYTGLANRIRTALKTLKAQEKTLSALQNRSNEDRIKMKAA